MFCFCGASDFVPVRSERVEQCQGECGGQVGVQNVQETELAGCGSVESKGVSEGCWSSRFETQGKTWEKRKTPGSI